MESRVLVKQVPIGKAPVRQLDCLTGAFVFGIFIMPKPPSDEGGGKTEGFDGGREVALPLEDLSLSQLR